MAAERVETIDFTQKHVIHVFLVQVLREKNDFFININCTIRECSVLARLQLFVYIREKKNSIFRRIFVAPFHFARLSSHNTPNNWLTRSRTYYSERAVINLSSKCFHFDYSRSWAEQRRVNKEQREYQTNFSRCHEMMLAGKFKERKKKKELLSLNVSTYCEFKYEGGGGNCGLKAKNQ